MKVIDVFLASVIGLAIIGGIFREEIYDPLLTWLDLYIPLQEGQ